MAREAIRQDVSAEETAVQAEDQAQQEQQSGEEKPKGLTPADRREEMMARLYDSRADEIGGEGGDLHPSSREYLEQQEELELDDDAEEDGEDDTETSKADDGQPEDSADQSETASRETPTSGVYRNEAGQEVMKLKVNGQEQEVPLAQIQATAQKNWAADQRLQQAAELQKNLQAYEQQLADREQRLLQTMNQPPKSGADNEQDTRALAQSLVNTLYEGDTDAATEQLAQILAGRQSPTLDPNVLVQQAQQAALSAVEQKEKARQEEAFQSSVQEGNREFSEKYAEIWNDPQLYSVAQQKTVSLQQEMAGASPKDIILEAGRQTQEWVNSVKGVKTSPQGEREAAKRNLKPMPKGSGAKHAPPAKSEAEDQSAQAVIARMRQERQVV